MRRLLARFTAQTRNDRGVALFAAIAGMVLLSTMIAALVILARNENLIAQLNKDEAQAAYAAEAGANWGRRLLQQRLNVDLPAAVSLAGRTAMKTALVTTYYTSDGGAQFIRDYADPHERAGVPDVLGRLHGAQLQRGRKHPGCPADRHDDHLPGDDRLSGEPGVHHPRDRGHASDDPARHHQWRSRRGLHLRVADRVERHGRTRAPAVGDPRLLGAGRTRFGSFRIALNAEFVKYAHFIDQFQDAGSGDPWMSWRHVYTGPVHTNTRFSILGDTSVAGREGPIFRSEATQTLTTTRFSNGGSEQNLSRDSSSRDWPLLGPDPGILCKQVDCSGFTRGRSTSTR